MLLESPDLPAEVKAHRLAEVCGDELDSSANCFSRRLLSIIGYPFCLKCLRSLKSLKRKRKDIDVEVLSAFELTETQVEEIKSTLNKRFDKQINIESSVDKTLIGGAIIRAGDLVIDGSARGKLTKLADTLTRS